MIPPSVGITSISLERTACYGECPIYSVDLHGDGTAEYLGLRFMEKEGPVLGQVGEEFERLAWLIVRLGFFS
jgi:hypothetical protein